MHPIFRATIRKGKAIFHNLSQFNGYISNLEGKDVDVIVKKRSKTRSNPQNAFYWGVAIKILCDEIGYTDDEMHATLKIMFLQDKTRKFPTLRSTTTLTTVEFEEYLEKIRQWAAQDLNCVIPLPNEVDFSIPEENFKDTSDDKQDPKFLNEVFAMAAMGGMNADEVFALSMKEFEGKQPNELTQTQLERLHTYVVVSKKSLDLSK